MLPQAAAETRLHQRRRQRYFYYFAIPLGLAVVFLVYLHTIVSLDDPWATGGTPFSWELGNLSSPTRRNKLKPAIAIVVGAVSYPFSDASAREMQRFADHLANKECYASMHGYDLIVDPRNHVEGMGFFVDPDTGARGDTNVHFNKPFLLRKWLPFYDWVLWLDLDTLVLDMERPIESFIDKFGSEDIQVLLPQEQNALFMFSAYAILLKNTQQTQAMVQDWFDLKDACPFAKYDDQWRLYAAILRMQLRYKGVLVDHSSPMNTDCLDRCESLEKRGTFVFCFDNAVRASGYARMPELKAPVAYSALPTEGFTSDVDSGLTLQGMFGGIMKRPELENHAFSVHIKPHCQKGRSVCPAYVQARYDPRLWSGMEKCFGSHGWFGNPSGVLSHIAEMVQTPERNPSFSVPFGDVVNGPLRRTFGSEGNSGACFASIHGTGGAFFASHILEPLAKLYRCSTGSGECAAAGSLFSSPVLEDRKHTGCRFHDDVGLFWPHILFQSFAEDWDRKDWLFSFLRNPVDRILIAYVRYVMELPGDSCADALYRHVPEKNDITVEQFMELRSSEGHDDYSKFFRGNPWWTKQKWGNGRCMGRPKNDIFWSNTPNFVWTAGNEAAGELLLYHFFGIFEQWDASVQLLQETLGGGLRLLEGQPTQVEALQNELPSVEAMQLFERLRMDKQLRGIIEEKVAVDTFMYNQALSEFARRCQYFGIPLHLST